MQHGRCCSSVVQGQHARPERLATRITRSIGQKIAQLDHSHRSVARRQHAWPASPIAHATWPPTPHWDRHIGRATLSHSHRARSAGQPRAHPGGGVAPCGAGGGVPAARGHVLATRRLCSCRTGVPPLPRGAGSVVGSSYMRRSDDLVIRVCEREGEAYFFFFHVASKSSVESKKHEAEL